jgi:hypothetical protein
MPFFRIADADIVGLCGRDSYLFLRYLRTMVLIYGPLSLIVVPALLSLNLVKAPSGLRGTHGMDELSWSNVSTTDTARLWGHFGCAICIVSYSCFIVNSELKFYLRFFQKPENRKLATSMSSSRHLVLLTDIPDRMQTNGELRKFFSRKIPGRLQSVDILHDLRGLSAAIAKRDVKNAQLEKAETLLIQEVDASQERLGVQHTISDRPNVIGPKSASSFYVSDVEREQTRRRGGPWMPHIPLVGHRKDQIGSLREELALLSRQIQLKQYSSNSYPRQPSAILQFSSKFLAQAVEDFPNRPFPYCMLTRYLGTSTEDINWTNLGSRWWERQLRSILFSILSVAVVLGWTVPIAFTGVLSQLSYLAELFPWLDWVSRLPVWFIAFLQGVLPQITLSVLMLIFPAVLRAIIKQRRLFTKTAIELSLQKYYFAFLFIHLFFTVSISSGVVTVFAELLNSPKLGPIILARNLPKASNYFISYVLFQAFFVSGFIFGQPVGIVRHAFNSMAATTPRERAANAYNISLIQWGTFFPVYTNMGCIGKPLYLASHTVLF